MTPSLTLHGPNHTHTAHTHTHTHTHTHITCNQGLIDPKGVFNMTPDIRIQCTLSTFYLIIRAYHVHPIDEWFG